MLDVTDISGNDILIAYLGLGTNLGDRQANLQMALEELSALPTIEMGAVSSVYETAPQGMIEQPDFLNMAAEVHTALSPRELLDVLLHIENKMGRVRNLRWGPRVIDLDLLLYGDAQVILPGLTVPHPRLWERVFVLVPLAEIAPDRLLPGERETLAERAKNLLENSGQDGNIRRGAVVQLR